VSKATQLTTQLNSTSSWVWVVSL